MIFSVNNIRDVCGSIIISKYLSEPIIINLEQPISEKIDAFLAFMARNEDLQTLIKVYVTEGH